MRGDDQQLQTGMFSYVALEERIPADHPLRGVRKLVDVVLAGMSKEFDGLYSEVGRPSIAPERLLRALLLQVFYSVRSERLLMEQLNYNLLFRWFVGLEIDEEVWNHAVFSKNRDRLLNQDLAQKFFAHVKEQAAGLMSDEHFTVDGTLIEAWAGQKSFRRKDEDGGPKDGGNFHGEPRRNQTHASRTDPEARLYKKSAGQLRHSNGTLDVLSWDHLSLSDYLFPSSSLLVDSRSAGDRPYDLHVLDLLLLYGVKIVREDDEVGQFAGRNGPFDRFFVRVVSTVDSVDL